MDYYVILGVARTAGETAIRSAFRELARRYHPDAGAGSSAHKFREIVEAYATLADPDRRRRYDARLRPAVAPLRRVERLTSDRPEPLFSPRVTVISPVVDAWTYHECAFDDLLQSMDRLFWDF